MSLRLCLKTKQYTYYFSKSLTWNLFRIVKTRKDYIFSIFVLKSTSILSQTSFFLFHPRSRERNDEYKFDEECFPAKVSPLLQGSKGLGEEGDVFLYTFVPKVPSYTFRIPLRSLSAIFQKSSEPSQTSLKRSIVHIGKFYKM